MRISDWSSDVCSSDLSEQNTLDPDIIEEAAIALRTAAEKRSPIPPLRESLSGGGVAAAYAVQELNTRHALSSGRRLVGRKIGLTSRAVQKQLGVDQPDHGMPFADMDLPEGGPNRQGRQRVGKSV